MVIFDIQPIQKPRLIHDGEPYLRQNVGCQRMKDGFVNLTLPHFAKGSREPKARGFVQNSFYSPSATQNWKKGLLMLI